MPMNPLERKAELVRRGIRVLDVAGLLGLSPSRVSSVLSGLSRNRRVEEAIASQIGSDRLTCFGPMPGEQDVPPAAPSAVA